MLLFITVAWRGVGNPQRTPVVRPVSSLFDQLAPGTIQRRFPRLEAIRREFQLRLTYGKSILFDQHQAAIF
jgi:hypothetical protein